MRLVTTLNEWITGPTGFGETCNPNCLAIFSNIANLGMQYLNLDMLARDSHPFYNHWLASENNFRWKEVFGV